MIDYSCIYECGDEDCNKCFKQGIIFCCPYDCPDYVDHFGRNHKGEKVIDWRKKNE